MRLGEGSGCPIAFSIVEFSCALMYIKATFDEAGINGIFVGDSLGMVCLGYEDTLSVTMEDMIHHTSAVTRGAKNSLVVADMPFMSYQTCVYDAVVNAGRLIKEGRAQAVKLEGGIEVCDKIEAIVKASIPVMGHIGLTPQSVNAFGGFKVQGKDEEAEKMDAQLHSATSRGLPWKKEHEAMVLYYRSEINGLLMDSHESGLEIVYVPNMDKIVLISGYTPYEQIADSETNELISEKVAMSQAAQTLGIRTQDDIQIDAVSLVYAMQYAGTDQMCAVPAWKVDYVLKNVDENTQIRDPGSLLIDAVSGFVADYWKQD